MLRISPTQSEFQVLFTEPRFEMTPIGDKTLKTDAGKLAPFEYLITEKNL